MAHLSIHLIPERQGGHTWVKVFAGKDADHRAKCGDLCFRNEEYDLMAPGLAALTEAWSYADGALDIVVDPVEEQK
jgi:diadenosine tetraphosphate (Ap4A) HIT family hydrolase